MVSRKWAQVALRTKCLRIIVSRSLQQDSSHLQTYTIF